MVESPTPPAASNTCNTASPHQQIPSNEFTSANAATGQRAARNSIYKVHFPIVKSASDASPRDPYKCVKHILAILSKCCTDLRVLPKNENDTANESVCLWSNFPSTKAAADAYLFNVRYPGQNFGNRAGAVDFKAEFRVSYSSTVKWMKSNTEVRSELERHQYTVSGRADGPAVRTTPILWLVGPDPDNCSIANLKSLLSEHIPETSFIHLEKHRVASRPDNQKKCL